jgi:cytochrome b involved in lipid metabolism
LILVLRGVAGKDATQKFQKYHRESIFDRYKQRLKVGEVKMAPIAEKKEEKEKSSSKFGLSRLWSGSKK